MPAPVRVRRRFGLRGAALVACTSLTAALGLLALEAPASALEAPVAFTSQALPTWQTKGTVWAVASAQGMVFAGGTFSAVRPPGSASGSNEVPASNIVALDAATGSPTSCALSVTLPADPASATVRALTVSPDGRTLYIGGYFSTVNGVPAQHLAAIDIQTCR